MVLNGLTQTRPTDRIHAAFDWREVVRLMLTSRTLDELEEQELVPQGHINYQFSARGHELGQLLLSQLLTHPHDAVSSYYRSRPLLFGLGFTVKEALVSDMARIGSINGGRDIGVVFQMPHRGRAMVLPEAADVGSQYTPAAGYAQAITYRVRELGEADWDRAICVVCGGDGSVASNGFWSSLTIATTLELPLLFVIEDNGYAISVKGPAQTPGGDIAANLASFTNLKVWDGSGTQPAETAELVYEAANYVRDWNGPALLHLKVPRLSGHSSVDNQAYKSADEVKAEWSHDPIPALRDYLVPAHMSADEWDALAEEAHQAVVEASEHALAQPQPDVATVTQFIFSDPDHPQEVGGLLLEEFQFPRGSSTPNPPDPRRLSMLEAIRRALDSELAVNPYCLIFGEDVGYKGGVHAVTLGLQEKHGERRVVDTSLSEEGIMGRAVGMTYAGLMPVPEIQYRKYADPATEQINNCGTVRWRTNNRFAAPLVLRLAGGFRRVGDPWHSVTGEATFAHQPGWLVAAPSNAEDAVGLLRTALRGNDPVIFFEHRFCLDSSWARRPYPGDDYLLPFGQAKIVETGTDLTVVTWGAMVERCELAAKETGASVEIIDLRTIVPWDQNTVLDSVRKTGKCLIVHEEILVAGFGAEVAAVISQEAFTHLDAPIKRIGAPSTMVPFNTELMEGVIPQVATIRDSMRELLDF